ncbi:MAG: hypothetical protein ACLUVG_08535 [Phocaeicola vulgatus]
MDEMIYNFADFYFEATTEINPDPGVSPEVYDAQKGPDFAFDQTSSQKTCCIGMLLISLHPLATIHRI